MKKLHKKEDTEVLHQQAKKIKRLCPTVYRYNLRVFTDCTNRQALLMKNTPFF